MTIKYKAIETSGKFVKGETYSAEEVSSFLAKYAKKEDQSVLVEVAVEEPAPKPTTKKTTKKVVKK